MSTRRQPTRPRAHWYAPAPLEFDVWLLAQDGPSCWLSPETHPVLGYGIVRVDGGQEYAHRRAWTLLVGPIPDDMTVEHICHTEHPTCSGGGSCPHRPCCNPGHLELLTRAENSRRGGLRAVRLGLGMWAPRETTIKL